MTDYVKTTNFTAKDALTTGDPNKIISGVDFDTEFDDIATAIATKLDADDIANESQAEGGTSNAVLMTPGRTTDWAQANAGAVADLQALADPDADRVPFWDDSAGALVWGTPGSGLSISTTTISVDHDAATNFVANEHIDHSGVSITAGDGLSGGGTIAATRTLTVDATVLRTTGAFGVSGDWTITGDWDFDGVVPTIDGTPIATTSDISAAGVYAGYVGANGTTGNSLPSGWSASRDSQGVYTIVHNLGLSSGLDLSVTVSPVLTSGTDDRYGLVTAPATDNFDVIMGDVGSGLVDQAFFFLAKVNV